MDKSLFFDQLHIELANKYNCLPQYIQYIRSGHFHFQSNKKNMIERTLTRLKKLIEKKKRSTKDISNKISFIRGRLQFLRSLSDEDFIKITVKTAYDK